MAFSPQDSAAIAKIFKDLWKSSMNTDSTVLIRKFDSLWTSTIAKDSIISSQNFYSDYFNKLIATHVGLFSALIAIAIAIFVIKYWIDNKFFDQAVEKKIDSKLEENKNKIDEAKEIEKTATQSVYASMIRSILNMDKNKECTKDLIQLTTTYLGLFNEEPSVEIPVLFERMLEDGQKEQLENYAVPFLEALDNLFENDDNAYDHLVDQKYADVLEMYGTEDLKKKEEKRKQRRNSNQPQLSIWGKIKQSCREVAKIWTN